MVSTRSFASQHINLRSSYFHDCQRIVLLEWIFHLHKFSSTKQYSTSKHLRLVQQRRFDLHPTIHRTSIWYTAVHCIFDGLAFPLYYKNLHLLLYCQHLYKMRLESEHLLRTWQNTKKTEQDYLFWKATKWKTTMKMSHFRPIKILPWWTKHSVATLFQRFRNQIFAISFIQNVSILISASGTSSLNATAASFWTLKFEKYVKNLTKTIKGD